MSSTTSSFTGSTPRLARPRPATASSPNLRGARPRVLNSKISSSALTSGTLATIPDASESYALGTLDGAGEGRGSSTRRMPPFTPSRGDGLEVGDLVDVPGNMHGTVKFIGNVNGKKGTFAGVELSEEFAARGKNNGDVDGISYFTTSVVGAGIFLPLNRATRRGSPSSHEGSFPITPTTPSIGAGVKIAGQGHPSFTPPTPSGQKFSQSVGPGRVPSPGPKKLRPSLPRPESPLRKSALTSRPSVTTPKGPARYASPAGQFGKSVRGTADSRDPSKKLGFTPANGQRSIPARSASALGQKYVQYSDDDITPIGIHRAATNGSIGSVSSFNAKIRPASRATNNDEVDRLRAQLEERDRQLKEQASSLAEMESSLAEVQTLMNASEGGSSRSRDNRSSMEGKDAAQLRAVLREKNERIAMLTAEFDAHRADFRSTIDTLEMASTETERVYEKRVEDLVQEIQAMAEGRDDVENVAVQLKQLEELVQELEDGLEDARRGEAEARGEVEFLRGEVERTRSELRREREKASAASGTNGDSAGISKDVEHRDDEIRGLKAIIHSLSRDAVPDMSSPGNVDLQQTPTNKMKHAGESVDRLAREKLEAEIIELKAVVQTKASKEDELEREVERLRRSRANVHNRASAMSTATVTQDRTSARDSKGTVASWRERASPEQHRERRGNTLETMPESDTYSSANESFCELCETAGHDILTCTNMFSADGGRPQKSIHPASLTIEDPGHIKLRTSKDAVIKGLSPKVGQDGWNGSVAPLSPIKKPLPEIPAALPMKIIPSPMESGPVAGKESGVVNMDEWCGVCEREGHNSIDCPFEDAF